jgi:hypothetical protein
VSSIKTVLDPNAQESESGLRTILRGDFFPSPFPPGDKRSLALFFVVVALVLAFVTFPPVFLPVGVDVPFCGVF